MLIYVASPYRDIAPLQVERNYAQARNLCEMVIQAGHTPLASHVFYHNLFFDDLKTHRTRAVKIGLHLVSISNAIIHVGYVASNGVRGEVDCFRRCHFNDIGPFRELTLDGIHQRGWSEAIHSFLNALAGKMIS